MRTMSLILLIEMSPSPTSFSNGFGCSIVYVLLFQTLNEVYVHAIRDEGIDSYDQFRYDAWSFDDTSAFVIYILY